MSKKCRFKAAALSIAVGLVLAGCASSVGLTEKEQALLGSGWNTALTAVSATASIEQMKNWWQAWNEPELMVLISKAVEANTDIKTAQANLRSAAALADSATAELFPSASLSGGGSRSREKHKSTESWNAGGEAIWSVSLVGGNIAAQRAANYEALSSAMTLEDTRAAVVSEVAQNFINIRLAMVKLTIAEETLKNYEQTEQIARWRLVAGLCEQSEVDQAVSNTESARAQIPALTLAVSQYKNALARLTVQNVRDVVVTDTGAVPTAPTYLAVSIPADLIRQRPDMRSAEYALIAAGDRVYEARSAWFPTLKLTGNIGTKAATIGALGASGTGVSALIGALSMPLFNWGTQVEATEKAKANWDKAKATYTATLLGALEDTENALGGIESAAARVAALGASRVAAESAAELSLLQYRSGLVDYDNVLNTQRTLLKARESERSNEADLATQLVALYRAMGGSWQGVAEQPADQKSN